MKHKNILVVYKQSAYEIYFLKRKNILFKKRIFAEVLARLKETHAVHYETLAYVEKVLAEQNLLYKRIIRGRKANYDGYDLIITVGGDGTFLEAARNIKKQAILGVNSDPKWSIGQFCAVDKRAFKNVLRKVLAGKIKPKLFPRMQLKTEALHSPLIILNDLLMCHHNPAAMSRYRLTVGKISEEQRSSGLWVSTAAGSSGVMRSAGGKRLSPESCKVQYKPRELHRHPKNKNKLTGGVIFLKDPLKIVSLMREGAIFVDGCHVEIPFHFGSSAQLRSSAYPLHIIK